MKPLKKGTPGKGGCGKTDSFSYTPVAHGLKGYFSAFLAGDVYWALAHEHTKAAPGTKPCLEWLTDGAVRCARCRPQTCPTWVGWVPLYREQDHAPLLVIVHESAMDLLTGLKYPNHVLVGRVADTASVFVRKSDNALSFRTDNEQRKCPRDITADLLTMWGLPELERWLLDQRRGEQVTALKSNGEQFDAMHANAAARYTPPIDGATESEDLYRAPVKRILDRVKASEVEKNGKHKPT